VAYGLTMTYGTPSDPTLVIGQSVPFSGLMAGRVTMVYANLTPLNASLVIAHTVTLSSLAPGTVYHHHVRSRSAGDIWVSRPT
jgi:hypothetical protein